MKNFNYIYSFQDKKWYPLVNGKGRQILKNYLIAYKKGGSSLCKTISNKNLIECNSLNNCYMNILDNCVSDTDLDLSEYKNLIETQDKLKRDERTFKNNFKNDFKNNYQQDIFYENTDPVVQNVTIGKEIDKKLLSMWKTLPNNLGKVTKCQKGSRPCGKVCKKCKFNCYQPHTCHCYQATCEPIIQEKLDIPECVCKKKWKAPSKGCKSIVEGCPKYACDGSIHSWCRPEKIPCKGSLNREGFMDCQQTNDHENNRIDQNINKNISKNNIDKKLILGWKTLPRKHNKTFQCTRGITKPCGHVCIPCYSNCTHSHTTDC